MEYPQGDIIMTDAMAGKVCMVTGANSGIGKVTALELARIGATVVMVCRNQQKGEAAQTEIRQTTGNPNVDLLLADMASQQSIRDLAAAFQSKYDRLHVLVNNAGGMWMQRTVTVDGLETTFAVNHLGYFLLTNLLLDVLKASAPARVVNVSSDAHKIGPLPFDDLQGQTRYHGFRAYGYSKLGNILFTVELARQLEGTGVTVNCLHPGMVDTNFGKGNGLKLPWPFGWMMRKLTISPERGAQTSLYLATSPAVEGVTGKYFAKQKPARPSRAARDTEAARRLWQVSAELTGLAR